MVKYEIISGKTIEELVAKVNWRLAHGWWVIGSAFYTHNPEFLFAQTMILDDKNMADTAPLVSPNWWRNPKN